MGVAAGVAAAGSAAGSAGVAAGALVAAGADAAGAEGVALAATRWRAASAAAAAARRSRACSAASIVPSSPLALASTAWRRLIRLSTVALCSWAAATCFSLVARSSMSFARSFCSFCLPVFRPPTTSASRWPTRSRRSTWSAAAVMLPLVMRTSASEGVGVA